MGMGDEILVVYRNKLFSELPEFQGFIKKDVGDYHSAIINNHHFAVRSLELENDGSIQQPIPYVWLVNPTNKKVFVYTRSAGHTDMRLSKKMSGGIGGHIDRATEGDSSLSDPIAGAMMRELREEVVLKEYPTPEIVGFLNDDSESVGSVHFGVVGIAKTSEDVRGQGDEFVGGAWKSVDEVEAEFARDEVDVEGWTKLSWPFVKDYISKL